MIVNKFSEGFSNLTFLVEIGEWKAVLRRAPAGYVPPKAHDMKREYNILKKIHPVFPLAPEPYIFCDDNTIMDKPFYLMEKKDGVVIDGEMPSNYQNNIIAKESISNSVVSTLVKLHNINYKNANLRDIGKPSGYLERQVNGWIKRYSKSKTDEIHVVNELEEWFLQHIPTQHEATIVHNDFKLNNMIFDNDLPGKITGVLDWELSTIGDPLTDLGSTLVCWGGKGDPNIGIDMVTDQPGFYSRRRFLEEYAYRSGRDVQDINYYLAFGFYKLAVIQQQLHYRWKIGEVEDNRLEALKESISNLMMLAHKTVHNEII
ncbi:phosphotransferase family protein [Oceanobacillus halophilus]|uniref:Phosphotransferase family protein n=2 Tax=Oceanobacillus halophilus TaxID=930130 RepID=A0A495A7Y1_9BACI|nr:phosphotransferase family protein [Oceanobacillus halophilus]